MPWFDGNTRSTWRTAPGVSLLWTKAAAEKLSHHPEAVSDSHA